MTKHGFKRIAVLVAAAVLALGVLSACTSPMQTSANSAQQANRTYMSQVNQIMETLQTDLKGFTDAVSRNDLVNMQTQADSALSDLDKLGSLDVPDGFDDIQSNYVDGTTKLRQALNDYIALYTEMAKTDGSYDQDAYNARIATIQQEYNDGVAALKAGDEAAASK